MYKRYFLIGVDFKVRFLMKNFLVSSAVTCAALCAALASTANAQPNDEWNGKPRVFAVNALTPHVTSMPYSTVEEAVKGDRHASEWYQTLSPC